jgi:hypothetical protein
MSVRASEERIRTEASRAEKRNAHRGARRNDEARGIAAQCRHHAMCKIDYLGTGLCPSGAEKQYVSYYPQGRMNLYDALARGLISVTEALVDIASSCMHEKGSTVRCSLHSRVSRRHSACPLDSGMPSADSVLYLCETMEHRPLAAVASILTSLDATVARTSMTAFDA